MGISLESIKLAKERLKNIIEETKVIKSKIFTEESGNEIYIKPENLQKTGAFKIRGAYNKIALMSEDKRAKGIIASSAGNHAQGLAYAANKLGVEATIVMPKATPLIKVEATKTYGATVILHGDYYDEAYQKAVELAKEKDYTFVHPFNDYQVIEGQGTISLEILKELPDTDIIIVPIGGGGLIAGIALAAKELKKDIKIIGVEPEGANAMKLSLESGELTEIDFVETIADGVAVKVPGDKPFKLVQKYVDEIITVSDADLMESFLLLLEKHKIVAENSGVLPLAALKKIKEKGKKIVCVVSGGNIDVVTISAMINRGLVSRGRVFCFSVELPDKPGELLKISEILTKQSANIIKLDHNQFKTVDRFMRVHLEVTIETNGHKHLEKITKALNKGGYEIVKIY